MNNITNVLFNLVSSYTFHDLMNLDGWPVDVEGEPQSTENVTIVTIREDEIDLLVGGDWQEPKYVTLCLDEDNDLQIKDYSGSLQEELIVMCLMSSSGFSITLDRDFLEHCILMKGDEEIKTKSLLKKLDDITSVYETHTYVNVKAGDVLVSHGRY